MQIENPNAFRSVASPLTPDMLAPLPAESPGVSFEEPLTDADFQALSDFIADYPDKKLFAMQLGPASWSEEPSVEREITDLEFLRFFPKLKRFTCDMFYLKSLDGLRHLDACTELRIYKSPTRMSVQVVGELDKLEYLMLDGQTRDLSALESLPNLTTLSLGSARKLPGLDFLPRSLRSFTMNLGSITDISAIADTALETLAFFKVSGLADLSPISHLTSLRALRLHHLKEVANLPDMSALTQLTELVIDDLKKLSDTRPVLTAPNLTELAVTNLANIDPQAWEATWKTWIAQGRRPFWDQ
ncbi:leucine-rich repeat domain-containing protein [Mycolicibacterium fluoranthenivorans]|uniref:leucine-rich repeat domain-containing protein n=1 Tax=Mycolicibacterium fluoranthenivorans TaxID=258505 RepID=UPI000B291B87|nr:leucine-rich repeat domain-containing protein [Mycolicibacterium fluoranthenivorans]